MLHLHSLWIHPVGKRSQRKRCHVGAYSYRNYRFYCGEFVGTKMNVDYNQTKPNQIQLQTEPNSKHIRATDVLHNTQLSCVYACCVSQNIVVLMLLNE